jgi:hypothetical protein
MNSLECYAYMYGKHIKVNEFLPKGINVSHIWRLIYGAPWKKLKLLIVVDSSGLDMTNFVEIFKRIQQIRKHYM